MREEKIKELEKYVKELKWYDNRLIEPKRNFITVVPQRFYLNNGACIDREEILKNERAGSAVIIVPKVGDELLVTVEPRVFTEKRVAVGFTAGYIEMYETPKKAALRELREETGYIPHGLENGIEEVDAFYQDEGISAAYNHIFFANDCEKAFKQKLDKDEFVRYMTFTYDELLELEEMGYISGSNSKLALCRTKKYLNNN